VIIPPVSCKSDNLKKRARILQSIRAFFIERDYLEAETPVRCPGVIPEAHIDPVMSEGWYLQASPELCMKRILSMGADRLFQVSRCFRKGERGERHLPEMTLLEWYEKNITCERLMADCEALVQRIAHDLDPGGALVFQGRAVQLSAPWRRLSVQEAFERYAAVSMEKALAEGCFDKIIGFEIEPCLGYDRPVFLYDYPACQASLAKLNPKNPRFAQRFELYIAGMELANAFTELTDPEEQRRRFKMENTHRKNRGESVIPIPEKFLSDLARMGDAAGIALGVDRLVMLFCDALRIDDVVWFTPEQL
jgi:elongation factor P--(R)-beta-lysine ligase